MEHCRLHQFLAVVTINSVSDVPRIVPSVEYWLCIPSYVYEQILGLCWLCMDVVTVTSSFQYQSMSAVSKTVQCVHSCCLFLKIIVFVNFVLYHVVEFTCTLVRPW